MGGWTEDGRTDAMVPVLALLAADGRTDGRLDERMDGGWSFCPNSFNSSLHFVVGWTSSLN